MSWLSAIRCLSPSQPITFSPLNLHLTPLDHKDQRLKLKSEQPVMSDNLLAATAARRLSNTHELECSSWMLLRFATVSSRCLHHSPLSSSYAIAKHFLTSIKPSFRHGSEFRTFATSDRVCRRSSGGGLDRFTLAQILTW